MSEFNYEDFLSPFTWRYGSAEMRHIWSQSHKRQLWRRIWVALAEAQSEVGLVTEAQVEDLRAHQRDIDMAKAHAIEAEIHHDLMAEVRFYAAQCEVGGGIIHLGATSMDIEDNADAIRLREALDRVVGRVEELMEAVAGSIETWADTPTMAFTHLQPAEPTTIGYRLAQIGQDLLDDHEALSWARARLKGKGLKGAAGTSASYGQLLEGSGVTPAELEAKVMSRLGLTPAVVATQTSPRKQEYQILSALAGLGQTLYKFAFDLRILQSPVLGEWAEPFGSRQVGSSAMPFKRNPINAENINSQARLLAALPRVAWDNAAHSLLERTLDDSANRRTVLPESFLIADELLRRGLKLIRGLKVDVEAASRLLEVYGTFAATERVMMEAVKRGGDRQVLHEVIREHSLAAWATIRGGGANPLAARLCDDTRLTALLPADEVRGLLNAAEYLGDAPDRARRMASALRAALE